MSTPKDLFSFRVKLEPFPGCPAFQPFNYVYRPLFW